MEIFEQHPHWQNVNEMAKTLRASGYQALLAGGCVRDGLIARMPNDFDIATDAKPEEVEKLFEKSIAVGKEFGVIVVPFEGGQIEIATFRKDGEYKDGRHPENVEFSDAKEDALRRDFTINALFYDLEKGEVLDYVGGQEDLKAKVLRTVGEPKLRFEEDKLRILRALRFSAQLGFAIAEETFSAISEFSPQIDSVSGERIRIELSKLLLADQSAKGLKDLEQTGLLKKLLPGVGLSEEKTSWFEKNQVKEEAFVWALLYLPEVMSSLNEVTELSVAETKIQDVVSHSLKALKHSNQMIQETKETLLSWWALLNHDSIRPGELRLKMSHRLAKPLYELFKLNHEIPEIDCSELPEPYWNGKALLSLGFARGPEMGKLLKESYLRQLEGKSREQILSWLTSNK